MGIFSRRTSQAAVPDEVVAALECTRGERVLAHVVDDNNGAYVVATTLRVAAVTPDGRVVLERPWHEVDTGQWSTDTRTLTASWVDHARPAQWTFRDQTSRLPEVFKERVNATVLVTEPLGLSGPRRKGRVVLRKDLRTQQVFVQQVLGRSTDRHDPDVVEALDRVSAFLAEQAGL